VHVFDRKAKGGLRLRSQPRLLSSADHLGGGKIVSGSEFSHRGAVSKFHLPWQVGWPVFAKSCSDILEIRVRESPSRFTKIRPISIIGTIETM
jgi:hypothetical protein